MKFVKVRFKGKEVEGILIDKVRVKKRTKLIKDKVYEWEEYFIVLYLPKRFVGKKLLLIPLEG